ncbi:17298_t:CDS:2, partial [Dentiscutata erythropus]
MLKKINSLRGLQFVIDEAHCIKEYEYFRNSWTKLNVVKSGFPSVPMLFLTATCTLDTAEKLRAIITPSELQIIRSNKIYRPDLKLEIISKPCGKEKLIQAIISVIDSITNGRIIIYSASISDCITVGQLLIKHYGSQNIGIYHSSMKSADRDITLKLWKDSEIRFMSATNAFGMGINISDVRAIIHTTFPMSLDSFIQEIGRAGRDGNGGRNIIFFSRADLHTLTLILYGGHESIQENIEISQEFDESSSLTEMVAPTNQKKHLKEKRKQLLEMILIFRCHNCDNCCRREAISTEWRNVSNEVNWIVRIVDQLIKRVTSQDPKLLQISRDDITDCFMGSKGKNAVSKDLSSIEGYGVSSESCSIFNEDCLYLIDSLILAEIITEEVDIKYSKEAKSLSYLSSL